MGKRSDFKRVERDFYPTPKEAVLPLLPHLPEIIKYCEPCAGDARLIRHLEPHVCVAAYDIEPRHESVKQLNILELDDTGDSDYIITNPPWDRKILHPIIDHCMRLKPTWLLFDADWMHTKQSAEYMKYCVKVVSIGRVKWIEDSKMTGKDNCCWYLFDIHNTQQTLLYGRK